MQTKYERSSNLYLSFIFKELHNIYNIYTNKTQKKN